jgi:hypothetical protein
VLAIVVLATCWRAPLRGPNFAGEPFRREDLPAVPSRDDEPVFRLILAGDAGKVEDEDPTMALLARFGDARPERTRVVYLGDNLYPSGLQEIDRERGEAVLRRQVEASRAPKLFLPGNHDWGHRGRQWLLPRVLGDQQAFLESLGADFLPRDGCPGPATIELAAADDGLSGGLVLIAIDVHWWLLPVEHRPTCAGIDESSTFVDRLEALLVANRDRNVIVAAHHPLISGGPHGGHTRGFWTDLGVTIVYPFYRLQDVVEPGYREMVALLSRTLAANPPLAMVAGHDHSLQVIDGGDLARLVIVSGAASDTTTVTAIEGTIFAHAALGFVVLDFYRLEDGTEETMLVRVVEAAAGETPVFQMAVDLRDEEAPAAPVEDPESGRAADG